MSENTLETDDIKRYPYEDIKVFKSTLAINNPINYFDDLLDDEFEKIFKKGITITPEIFREFKRVANLTTHKVFARQEPYIPVAPNISKRNMDIIELYKKYKKGDLKRNEIAEMIQDSLDEELSTHRILGVIEQYFRDEKRLNQGTLFED